MKFKSTEVKVPVKDQFMDGTLYVPEAGEEKLPGVVIFHGRGSQKGRYMDRAEELAQAGFITLVFSFRGCGESDGNFKDQTPAMGYEDALAGYDFLVSQPHVDKDNVGVWGGSFGGYMAAFITKDRPVHSLILAAPALYKNEWWDTVLESLPEDVSQEYRNGEDFSDNNAIKTIEEYRGPILLIRHEQDDVCPKHQTKAFLNSAKNATLKKEKEIKGLGHRLTEEKHRAESNKITVSWFKQTLMKRSKNNEVALTDVILELHVPDFETIKKFYGKLGFEVVWEKPPKERSGYLVMKMNKSILAFYCGNEEVYSHSFFKKYPKSTVRGYGVEVAVYISGGDIDEYYKKVVSKIDKKHIAQELKTKRWGTKDFRLEDPFGYYLCFREPGNILKE